MSDADIPEGTVTVLFTDLFESTKLNQSLGDDAALDVGRQVETMARRLVQEHRGVLIKEMGDGFMTAFVSARRFVTTHGAQVRKSRSARSDRRRMEADAFEQLHQCLSSLHRSHHISSLAWPVLERRLRAG